MNFFNFRSQQELDENIELDALLTGSEKVKDVEFSTERSVERYFSRERVRQMLSFIIEEPDADAGQDRGHSMPFYSDMIFSFNKGAINSKFFRSEAQDLALKGEAQGSVEKKTSPQQMIDVFMTPQSEDEDLSDECASPNEVGVSSPDSDDKGSKQLSPPVSNFLGDLEKVVEPISIKAGDEESATGEVPEKPLTESEQDVTAAIDDSVNQECDNNNRNEVEEEKQGRQEGDCETDQAEQDKGKENDGETGEAETGVQPDENSDQVQVHSDTPQLKVPSEYPSDETIINKQEQESPEEKKALTASDEKMSRYLEVSDDSDAVCLSYDEDDEETVMQLAGVEQVNLPKESQGKEGEQSVSQDQKSSSNGEIRLQNKYALFEEYLSFLNVEKDEAGGTRLLNPVLLGYWCNLFRSLVQTNPQEVFIYVYEHQDLLDKMLDHLYSPQMSDIIVRLLNFNKSVFTRKDNSCSSSHDESKQSPSDVEVVSEIAAQEIRQSAVFSIITRIGSGYSFDQQRSALACLMDLPEEAQILQTMTSPSSLEQIKSYLQIDDDEIKTNCFKLLNHILSRTFDSSQNSDSQFMTSFGANSLQLNKDASKSDEHELQEVKKSVKEDLFKLMSDIVQLVISFDFQVTSGLSTTDKELSFAKIIGSERQDLPRLGMMRLAALELIEKLQTCYGLRMLEVFKEADLFSSLLKMYGLYPYNDIALRYVTNVISFALDPKLAKTMVLKQVPPKRQSRILDLEMTPQPEEPVVQPEVEEPLEDEQSRRDNLLVSMLYQTPLMEEIVKMCDRRGQLSFDKSKNKIEMGYVAHLGRLGELLLQLADQNEIVREQLDENDEWMVFEKFVLKPRISKREGSLCRGKQFEKQKESRFLSMFDDDEDEVEAPIDDIFCRNSVYGTGLADQRTNQTEMDQLMKPCLDYDDNDEEQDIGGLLQPTLQEKNESIAKKDGDEKEPAQYNIEKYFSNGDVDRGHNAQAVFSKRQGRAQGRARRYSDDLADPVGRLDDSKDTYKVIQRQNTDSDDDDTLERDADDPLSLEELDGWMNQINKTVKEDFSELKPKATIEETKDTSPNAEAEYLKKELENLQGKESPFAKLAAHEDEMEDDEDEMDLDFIAQVQKDKTELRASLLLEQKEQQSKQQLQLKQPEAPQEFSSNNYWKLQSETTDLDLESLLEDYS